jgi:hypothetical protein
MMLANGAKSFGKNHNDQSRLAQLENPARGGRRAGFNCCPSARDYGGR